MPRFLGFANPYASVGMPRQAVGNDATLQILEDVTENALTLGLLVVQAAMSASDEKRRVLLDSRPVQRSLRVLQELRC